jgi:hypothetical protein
MRNNKLVQINEGEYYLFFNFYKNNEKITLGYPYKNSRRNDVYLEINNEVRYVSFNEANKFLNSGIKQLLPLHRIKGITNTNNNILQNTNYGYCNNCGKKLRGDITKELCTDCWHNKNLKNRQTQSLNIVQNSLNTSQKETYELLKQGYSLEIISFKKQCTLGTILSHLTEINKIESISNYPKLKPNDFLVRRVLTAKNSVGKDFRLKDIYEKLNGEIDYNDIRLALFFI